jgi:hypothetical protein
VRNQNLTLGYECVTYLLESGPAFFAHAPARVS